MTGTDTDIRTAPIGTQLPADWELRKLGELCSKIGSGATPRGGSATYTQQGVSFVRSQNVFDHRFSSIGLAHIDDESAGKLANVELQSGDVLLNITGDGDTIARCCVVPEEILPARVSQHVLILRSAGQLVPEFLQRYLSHPSMRQFMLNHNSGGSRRALTKGLVAGFEIVVPSIQEQRGIADVLGALDDKIAANTKLAATSDELISLHFLRAVESAGTMSRPLFDAIDFDFGEPFRGSDFSEPGTGRPLIRIRDLKTFTSQVWTTENRSREILVQPGDVVVGMDAEFRPTSWLGEPGLLNQRVCRARGKSTGPAFVRETLKEPLGRIEGYKTATTVIHLNKKDLQEAEVLVPDSDSLALFEASVEVLYSQRVGLAIENRTLSAIRDALLPQLMSGKLRVKDAEKVLESAGV